MYTELLSPAGSFEGLKMAVHAGADAVYLAGESFGARAYAKNLTEEELLLGIDFAHLHGRRLYLTVNTLLKNKELTSKLYDYITPLYQQGLDAVIVQDLGVLRFIRREFPGLDIHASTQMTITGPEGIRFLENEGASRVVPARELSLDELAAMHRASPIEIETFIHGALCLSYSGQCLMSSLIGGRSGNRGRCAQPCRLPYSLEPSSENICALSLKDINTLEILPQIIEAGVMSLKIEGRMKQARYTAGVTQIYRRYLDKYLKDPEAPYMVAEEDMRALNDLFSRRGSCRGYYEIHNGPEMMAFENANKVGEANPEITDHKLQINGQVYLYPQSPAMLHISMGEHDITVCGPDAQYAKNKPVTQEQIHKQMNKLGDTPFVWKNLDIEMSDSIFLPIKEINSLRREGLRALENTICRKYRRILPQAEGKNPNEPEKINKADCKKPSYRGLYVSVRTEDQLKAALAAEDILGIYVPWNLICKDKGSEYHKDKNHIFGLAGDLISDKIYLELPEILRGSPGEPFWEVIARWLKDGLICGILAKNIEEFAALYRRGLAEYTITDASLYAWNDETMDFFAEHGALRVTLPLELKYGELAHLGKSDKRPSHICHGMDESGLPASGSGLHLQNEDACLPSELIIYGRIPMMVSAQCLNKNLKTCTGKNEILHLKDRKNAIFPVQCVCSPLAFTDSSKFCYNILFNSLPVSLIRDKEAVDCLCPDALRLNFTLESGRNTEKILKAFRQVFIKGRSLEETASLGETTRGHFKRGVE